MAAIPTKPHALVSALVLLACSYVAGQTFTDGNRLLEAMLSTSSEEQTWALGYVVGTIDTLNNERGLSPAAGCFTIPENTKAGELRDVVKLHLEQNLSGGQNMAASLVATAVQKAYPCKKSPR